MLKRKQFELTTQNQSKKRQSNNREQFVNTAAQTNEKFIRPVELDCWYKGQQGHGSEGAGRYCSGVRNVLIEKSILKLRGYDFSI